jgi:protein gp37
MGRPNIDWVIVGGESGPGARPMEAAWARSLRDQCAEAKVAFFMKQAGVVLAREWGLRGKGEDPSEWPEPFPQEYPESGVAA